VALLVRARVDASLLPAVVDGSPAKEGLRMPGTDIPIVGPSRLGDGPHDVVVFVPELIPEVRLAWPEAEAAGTRWVDIEALA
jgi:hypothetical protein